MCLLFLLFCSPRSSVCPFVDLFRTSALSTISLAFDRRWPPAIVLASGEPHLSGM